MIFSTALASSETETGIVRIASCARELGMHARNVLLRRSFHGVELSTESNDQSPQSEQTIVVDVEIFVERLKHNSMIQIEKVYIVVLL